MRNGLLGYFYGDDFQLDLRFIAATDKGQLSFDKTKLDESLLDETIKVIKWIAYLYVEEKGSYNLKLESSDCVIEVDGKVVPMNKAVISGGIKHTIVIKQFLSGGTKVKDIPSEKIFLNEQEISINYLIIPDEGEFPVNISRLLDSDNDGIPDEMEVNGYTVMGGILVPWNEKFKEKGYTKYVSNPKKSRTTGDPYSDLQKALGQMDESVDLIARDPMIAACPIISVHMEKLIISKNETENTNRGTSYSKNTSSSFATGDTKGVSVTAQAGYNIVPNFSVSVTGSYSKMTQNTTATSDTSGDSFSKGLSLNIGQAAFVNLNVRYFNSGTSPVYRLSPNVTLAINNDSVLSAQAENNQIAEYLNPSEYYPKNGLSAICFNTIDQFNSHFMQISQNQLNDIDQGKPINISVSQFKGLFGKINLNGDLVTNGNEWGPYISQIESKTASFIIECPDSIKEYKVAARNFNDPEDSTPILTIGEFMEKVPEIDFIEDFFHYPANVNLGGQSVEDAELCFTMDKDNNNNIVLSNIHSPKHEFEFDGDYLVSFYSPSGELKFELTIPSGGNIENVKIDIDNEIKKSSIKLEDYFILKNLDGTKISINQQLVSKHSKYTFGKDGIKVSKVFYNGEELSSLKQLSILMDEPTNKDLNMQLSVMKEKNILNCKIKPKMNMNFKIEDIGVMSVEDGNYHIIGTMDKGYFITLRGDDSLKLYDPNLVLDSNTESWSFKYDPLQKGYTIHHKGHILSLDINTMTVVYADPESQGHFWVLQEEKNGGYYIRNKEFPDRFLSVGQFEDLGIQAPIYCDWNKKSVHQIWKLKKL